MVEILSNKQHTVLVINFGYTRLIDRVTVTYYEQNNYGCQVISVGRQDVEFPMAFP